MIENAKIISNNGFSGGYFKLDFECSKICRKTKPGQFVHVQIHGLHDKILRRPFSICNVTEKGILTVIYKVVGEGTLALSKLKAGTICNLMGPQGNPFSIPQKNETPIIIAGGYGSAATYLLARKSLRPGIALLGARTKNDLILINEFKKTGFKVRTATEDGSNGHKGLVTELLALAIKEGLRNSHFYACGPHGMLMAVGKMLFKNDIKGELSLDHRMCCGIGACFACVVKVKDDNQQGWRYARTCKEGPVFNSDEIFYE